VVVGGWLVQAQGTPPKWHKYVFVLYVYCVIIAYYIVWDVSEVRMTHPWYIYNIYTAYMTVYLVILLPAIPYIYFWPTILIGRRYKGLRCGKVTHTGRPTAC
jgi:hypothetical protein